MKVGQKYTSELVVEDKHLACNVGSGDLPVFATPMMMALMENAAMMCVADDMAEGDSTVGGHIESSHIKPTAKGKRVSATAELTAIEGRKLSFRVTAQDEDGIIGEGKHLRFIINKEKFMGKLAK
ncbi:MAG: thioesterase family protein [Prevotella sp.]|nr:thioesterase family protein [Prevotella sp.]